ncbi:hypothetical protein V6N13_043343 [Hibiscus sabdariffa]
MKSKGAKTETSWSSGRCAGRFPNVLQKLVEFSSNSRHVETVVWISTLNLVKYGGVGGWRRRRGRKPEGSTTEIRDGGAWFEASSGFKDFEDPSPVAIKGECDVFRRLHCRDGFCFDNGVDQFPVAKRIIFYGRNEGELSVEELFLVWRSERFRKNKIGLSRSFLSGPLVARRCLPRSDFTYIASFLSLFWEKVQMLITGRQCYEVLVEAERGCDRVNVEVRTVTVASTQSTVALVNAEVRNHAIYAVGEGYNVRVYSSLLKDNGNTQILPYARYVFLPTLSGRFLGSLHPCKGTVCWFMLVFLWGMVPLVCLSSIVVSVLTSIYE